MYYLNVLGGEAHALAAADDPSHAWIRGTWSPDTLDSRLPLVKP
jgi:5-deoxy-glucuronate isomerase